MAVVDSKVFFARISKSMEAGQFDSVYLLYGEESYLLEQASRYLKTAVLVDVDRDFNFFEQSVPGIDLEVLQQESNTYPVFSPRRVFWIRQAHGLSEKQWLDLLGILKHSLPSNVFILVADKIDKRKKTSKAILDMATTCEFRKPFENQIPGWIRHIVQSKNLKIDDEAIGLLHRRVGNELFEIDQAIEKLKSYLHPQVQITAASVEAAVDRHPDQNVFQFTSLVFRRQLVPALQALSDLLQQQQNEVGMLSLLARQCRILILLKRGLADGLAGQKLAGHAGVSPFFLNDYIEQANLWRLSQLETCLMRLSGIEKNMKSSKITPHLWLESFIVNT